MATFSKREGKRGVRWQAKVRLLGHSPQTRSFPTLTAARTWATEIESALNRGHNVPDPATRKLLVLEAVKQYRKHLEAIAPLKLRKRKHHLTWIESELGPLRLVELTPARIIAARDRLQATPTHRDGQRSGADCNRHVATLSALCSLAVREWGWLQANPCAQVSKLKESQGRIRFLDDAERTGLLTACKESTNPALYPAVVLSIATGMRYGNLQALRWQDLDLERGWALLQKTKSGRRHGVPVVGHALDVMKEWAKPPHAPEDRVFPGQHKPDSPITLQFAWAKALEKAKLTDLRWHDLRHTTASYLAMAGASAPEIARITGHSTLAMVQRYAHLSDDHATQVAEKINERAFIAATDGRTTP